MNEFTAKENMDNFQAIDPVMCRSCNMIQVQPPQYICSSCGRDFKMRDCLMRTCIKCRSSMPLHNFPGTSDICFSCDINKSHMLLNQYIRQKPVSKGPNPHLGIPVPLSQFTPRVRGWRLPVLKDALRILKRDPTQAIEIVKPGRTGGWYTLLRFHSEIPLALFSSKKRLYLKLKENDK